MLIRNISIHEAGLCNGTRLRIIDLRRSYTYRPFCPKLSKKMIKNIIIIKLFKYIVNITYFE